MPAIGEEELFVVEFPGVVVNRDRATAMLGGRDAVKLAMQRQTASLELRWRPDDPFCHPTIGNVVGTNNLVLRVRRDPAKPDVVAQADIIGAATSTCRFRSMADFQFVPDKTCYEVQLRHQLASMDVEQLARLDVLGEYREDEGRGESMAGVIPSLPPPIFSRVDLPSEYEFKQNPAVAAVENSSKLVLENAQLPLMADTAMQLLNLAKLRRCVAYGTDFNAQTVPQAAPTILEDIEPLPKGARDRMQQFFEQRPVWTRLALETQLPPDDRKIVKRLLPHYAYFFTRGPWKSCWIKYGYDPRQSPDARIYQRVEVRLQRSANESLSSALQASSSSASSPWTPSAERRLAKRPRLAGDSSPAASASSLAGTPSRPLSARAHLLEPATPVSEQQSAYQLCDVLEPVIQSLVRLPDVTRSACDERTGWYFQEVYAELVSLCKARLRLGPSFVTDPSVIAGHPLAFGDQAAPGRAGSDGGATRVRGAGSRSARATPSKPPATLLAPGTGPLAHADVKGKVDALMQMLEAGRQPAAGAATATATTTAAAQPGGHHLYELGEEDEFQVFEEDDEDDDKEDDAHDDDDSS